MAALRPFEKMEDARMYEHIHDFCKYRSDLRRIKNQHSEKIICLIRELEEERKTVAQIDRMLSDLRHADFRYEPPDVPVIDMDEWRKQNPSPHAMTREQLVQKWRDNYAAVLKELSDREDGGKDVARD